MHILTHFVRVQTTNLHMYIVHCTLYDLRAAVYITQIISGAFYSNRKRKACLSCEWNVSACLCTCTVCGMYSVQLVDSRPNRFLSLRKFMKSIASHTCIPYAHTDTYLENTKISRHVDRKSLSVWYHVNTLCNAMRTQQSFFVLLNAHYIRTPNYRICSAQFCCENFIK